ncbi:hypothetical protein [Bradyrhizobium erythrophlei]|uniref:Uncharacterized protein n=1 Tax=Bradyrhizobium erythrophlei TaxID=1437360 RepID=A0A1M5NH28_9BRAD|nr:hypothetical protein [Bradyrhizobium erythrophlei]SHG88735.1 hypothetical protein SAMN05443248_2991 [Bradyrhizobium erythrophlei]
MTTKIHDVLAKTDWALLAQQKLALLRIDGNPAVDGLINFLDALQDAAEADGFPVVWLGESSR